MEKASRIYKSFQQKKKNRKMKILELCTLIRMCNTCQNGHLRMHKELKNTLYSDKESFLLKKSELTSLFIQHNQSPDTSIFTLHSNYGSKVEKELEREKREREISRGTIRPRNGKWRRTKRKKGGSMMRALRGQGGTKRVGDLWTRSIRDSQREECLEYSLHGMRPGMEVLIQWST